MNRIPAFVFVLAIAGLVRAVAAEPPPARIVELSQGDFAALGRDPVVVAAVKAQNAQGLTLEKIKEHDARWMAAAGVADFMKVLMDSEAGRHLIAWKAAHPYVSEVFVTDNLGANVAMTEKTSDYWQGDEKKFTECFKGGGEIYLGPMTFDESTQTYSIQVSVPVLEGDTLIGTACIGVDVEKL
jgi:hypothetical protein